MPPPDGLPSDLLPAAGLPLTAFEEFMFLDDRPTHPMVIAARLDFTDGPPPPTLGDAFAATLRHEPLLTARVATPRGGRPRWLPVAPPVLGWASEDEAETAVTLPRIDPRTGPMLQARVLGTSTGWSIIVAVHHAACDGLGLAGFLERWLARAAGRGERRREAGPASAAALGGRGRVAASWTEFGRLLPRLAKGLEGVWQFIGREVAVLGEPAPLPPADASAAAADWRPLVLAATLDADLLGRLDAAAARRGVKVNDLLMGAFLTAIGPAAAGQGARGGAEPWFRLATPLSLRTKSDYALPAVNRVSMVFLDRRSADWMHEDSLLTGLRDEMELIRSHHLGHILPLSLAVGRRCPGGLARSVRRPAPQSTAVLSNLGRCFHRSPLVADGDLRLGESRLAGWWMVPPVRPGTAVAAATHETLGRRTIAFHVDRSRVRPAEARGWLDRMRAVLDDFAGPAAPACVPLAAATP